MFQIPEILKHQPGAAIVFHGPKGSGMVGPGRSIIRDDVTMLRKHRPHLFQNGLPAVEGLCRAGLCVTANFALADEGEF